MGTYLDSALRAEAFHELIGTAGEIAGSLGRK